MYTEIKKCRICRKNRFITVLSLGEQYLTGIFPRTKQEKVTKGPLDMVWCTHCGLLQMKQTYNLDEMYGSNYGYRSGLNSSMIRHLQQKMRTLEAFVKPKSSDLIVDIGSNDATLLKACSGKYTKVGIDPIGEKFRKYYTKEITLIADFFSAHVFNKIFPKKKAKIITSIAMFYDLDKPKEFVKDITKCLTDDGVWHFEQSYMPSMLRTNAYDTVCHEHLEFYSFKVISKLLDSCDMRVVDVQMNAVNGGSFAVTACKKSAAYNSNKPVIKWMLKQEKDMGLDTPKPYRDLEEKVFRHRQNLRDLIKSLVVSGKKIIGYGASTKGNVLLQFCGLGVKQIPFIADVNEDKIGSYTPGTKIPIISEKSAKDKKPDYFLVLPWHFKHSILEREKDYMAKGGKFIFPLPEIEII